MMRAMALCIVALMAVASAQAASESPRYDFFGPAKLIEASAPNLIRVKMIEDGRVLTVRLIGVGSPHNRDRLRKLTPKLVAFIDESDVWEQSRSHVRTTLSGKIFELWACRFTRFDEKGRLLAYVKVRDEKQGSVDLNAELIKTGLGLVTRDYVHVTYADYKALEQDARSGKRGIWRGLVDSVALK